MKGQNPQAELLMQGILWDAQSGQIAHFPWGCSSPNFKI